VAKTCSTCHAKLGMFHSGLMCKDCEARLEAVESRIDTALADDILTPDEQAGVDRLIEQGGFTWWTDVATHNHPLVERFIVAKANDGRLEVMPKSFLMVGADEVVHLETPAAVMTEQVLREFKGGSRGVSVPIGHGARVRTGSFRGHSVVVGTQTVASDIGTMTISSKRLVFAGSKSTIEIRMAKPIDVKAFTDGVQIHSSNRKSPALPHRRQWHCRRGDDRRCAKGAPVVTHSRPRR
jgi:hypothetical protein